jgi:hypothetical protein
MVPYIYESSIVENGKLIIENLPFSNGDKIDIILLKHSKSENYSLRGTDFELINPTEPVADDDWQFN